MARDLDPISSPYSHFAITVGPINRMEIGIMYARRRVCTVYGRRKLFIVSCLAKIRILYSKETHKCMPSQYLVRTLLACCGRCNWSLPCNLCASTTITYCYRSMYVVHIITSNNNFDHENCEAEKKNYLSTTTQHREQVIVTITVCSSNCNDFFFRCCRRRHRCRGLFWVMCLSP